MTAPAEHTVVRLMQRPVGPIVPGKDLVAMRTKAPKVADLKEGQVSDFLVGLYHL